MAMVGCVMVRAIHSSLLPPPPWPPPRVPFCELISVSERRFAADAFLRQEQQHPMILNLYINNYFNTRDGLVRATSQVTLLMWSMMNEAEPRIK